MGAMPYHYMKGGGVHEEAYWKEEGRKKDNA